MNITSIHLQCACAIALTSSFSSAAAQTYFQKIYGGFSNERIQCVTSTADTGIVVGGYTSSFLNGNNSADLLMMKCDREGNVVWTKHYNAGLVSVAHDVVPTSDNGLLVTGTDNNTTAMVMKLNGAGEPEWGRRGSGVSHYNSASIANDSSIFIVGDTGGGNTDMVAEKLAWDGTPVWNLRFGSNYDETANGISATLDGGAIIAGSALVTQPESDGLLLKLDAAGNVEWTKTYGVSSVCDELHDVVECPNGGYLAVGAGCFSTTWPLIVRTDALGDTLWTRRLSDSQGRAVHVELTNYGYLISGNSVGAPRALFVVAMDDQGSVLWDRITHEYDQEMGAATVLPSGDVAFGGNIVDAGIGLWDVFIATLSGTGQGASCNLIAANLTALPTTWLLGTAGALLAPTGSYTSLPTASDCTFMEQTLCATSIGLFDPVVPQIGIQPNPTNGPLVITLDGAAEQLSLFDAVGRHVMTTDIVRERHTITMDLNGLGQGPYVLRVQFKNGMHSSHRIVKD